MTLATKPFNARDDIADFGGLLNLCVDYFMLAKMDSQSSPVTWQLGFSLQRGLEDITVKQVKDTATIILVYFSCPRSWKTFLPRVLI